MRANNAENDGSQQHEESKGSRRSHSREKSQRSQEKSIHDPNPEREEQDQVSKY